ncbi:hypothetical protein EYC84_009609 [Monilinia fructicola]|uniref:Uncharacterized protein n=1 Tax=Monilinia fructicola TaxID=38448 RepID=A0A5M9JCZ8_MONFR|nr:hypothetical protein EYC84_009609 [Monilinia fructicola]
MILIAIFIYRLSDKRIYESDYSSSTLSEQDSADSPRPPPAPGIGRPIVGGGGRPPFGVGGPGRPIVGGPPGPPGRPVVGGVGGVGGWFGGGRPIVGGVGEAGRPVAAGGGIGRPVVNDD